MSKKTIGILLLIAAMCMSASGCSDSSVSKEITDTTPAVEEITEAPAETEIAAEAEVTEASEEEEVSIEKDVIENSEQALAKLKEGNQLYTSTTKNQSVLNDELRQDLTDNGQNPYAVIITCGDSRVPAEHIFSAGLGDLFVIRNAGNVIGTYDAGSAEYAAEHLGTHLIVVLGHTNCGAVKSTLEGGAEGNIGSITDEIQSAIGEETDARECEWLNARNSVDRLMESEILAELVEEGKLTVIPAVYDITTGEVVFDETYGSEEKAETENEEAEVTEAAEVTETEVTELTTEAAE